MGLAPTDRPPSLSIPRNIEDNSSMIIYFYGDPSCSNAATSFPLLGLPLYAPASSQVVLRLLWRMEKMKGDEERGQCSRALAERYLWKQ
jgi:hypothetical protein